MLKKLLITYKEFILYMFFGVGTTVVNLLVYFLLTDLLRCNIYFSNVIAWILAVAFAFITNKLFVFSSRSWAPKILFPEIVQFTIARLLSLGIDMLVLYLGVELCGFNDMLVKIVSNVIVILINYVASKFVIFKPKKV